MAGTPVDPVQFSPLHSSSSYGGIISNGSIWYFSASSASGKRRGAWHGLGIRVTQRCLAPNAAVVLEDGE
jgi:hypothetical protein